MIRSAISLLVGVVALGCVPALSAKTDGNVAQARAHQQGPLRHHPQRPNDVQRHGSAAMKTGAGLPLPGIAAANRASVLQPDAAFYLGSAQVYPWSEGTLYALYTAPQQISDIALQPGENLVSVAAGDTVRWIIGDTSSGSGENRRAHILVKPAAAGLKTNILIATDRRIYHVEALSTPETSMASISWTYPQESMVALRARPALAPDVAVAPAVAVEALDFDYRIEGDDVAWKPVRAFDDGHATFIEFEPDIGDKELPPLFITGADGKAQLVNYRLKGRYYVVDQLFSAAELRLGSKHQQVVRILRYRRRRSPRRG